VIADVVEGGVDELALSGGLGHPVA